MCYFNFLKNSTNKEMFFAYRRQYVIAKKVQAVQPVHPNTTISVGLRDQVYTYMGLED